MTCKYEGLVNKGLNSKNFTHSVNQISLSLKERILFLTQEFLIDLQLKKEEKNSNTNL